MIEHSTLSTALQRNCMRETELLLCWPREKHTDIRSASFPVARERHQVRDAARK